MIRELRRRHASLILGLAVVVSVVFVAALAVRPTLPVVTAVSPPMEKDTMKTLLIGSVVALVLSVSASQFCAADAPAKKGAAAVPGNGGRGVRMSHASVCSWK